jgi:hypothetical protein
MSLTKAKQFLDGAGVGYRVVAGQGNGDSEAFAKKLIGDKTGTEASYVPHYTALIAVHRGIAVAAKKFDGKASTFKRFAAAIQDEVEKQLKGPLLADASVIVDTYKDYAKRTVIRVRVLDAERSDMCGNVTLEESVTNPVNEEKLVRSANQTISKAQDRLDAIKKSGDGSKAIAAAVKFHAALVELAEG